MRLPDIPIAAPDTFLARCELVAQAMKWHGRGRAAPDGWGSCHAHTHEEPRCWLGRLMDTIRLGQTVSLRSRALKRQEREKKEGKAQ